jgi:hypothetical protein
MKLVRECFFAILLCIVASATAQITISVAPNFVTVPSGGTQQFTASIVGTTNLGVTWYSCPQSNGTPTVITQTGLFTAPSVKKTTSICVYAISVADPSKSGIAYASVTPDTLVTSLSVFNGQALTPNTNILFKYTASSLDGVLTTATTSCGIVPTSFFNTAVGNTFAIQGLKSITSAFICQFSAPGTYPVTITWMDNLGVLGSASTSVIIAAPPAPLVKK